MNCSWTYKKNPKIDFDPMFTKIQNLILYGFAGNLDVGVQSTSTQGTSYLMEKHVLDNVKEVQFIEMTLPNLYYNAFDFTKFKSVSNDEEETVFVPLEKPNGLVHAEFERE